MMEKVFVTGASGFIALHCISELLKNGYAVKASLRDTSRQGEVEEAIQKQVSIENLEFCQLNLLKDDGWNDHLSDCDYLMHLASPFVLTPPKDEEELVAPAREGTLRAIKAAKINKISKIVLISSMAAVAYASSEKEVYTSNDWSDPSLEIGAYRKSKTIAERLAWELINSQEDKKLQMTTILPGFVFGPPLSRDLDGGSAQLMRRIIAGDLEGLPEHLSIADVRDVASLHVKSIKCKKSDGKRLLVTSPSPVHISFISKILNDNGIRVSGYKDLVQNFKSGGYNADISDTISIFDWKPINLEKTILDMAKLIQKN